MEKYIQNLQESERLWQTAGHLAYVTYPLVKDKRLLLKILIEIKNSLSKCINAVLQYEHLYKRIKLYGNPKINLETFAQKCSPRFKNFPGRNKKNFANF